MTPPPMRTLDELVKQHKGNVRQAAAAIAVDYFQLWRWHARKVYAPEFGSSRKVMAALGIELPHRPRRK